MFGLLVAKVSEIQPGSNPGYAGYGMAVCQDGTNHPFLFYDGHLFTSLNGVVTFDKGLITRQPELGDLIVFNMGDRMHPYWGYLKDLVDLLQGF